MESQPVLDMGLGYQRSRLCGKRGLERRGPIPMMRFVQTFRFAMPPLFGALLLAGCAGQGRPLMPTPMLYTGAAAKPVFDRIPAGRRSLVLDLLYITNRVPAADPNVEPPYSSERSKSVAFGSVRIDVGSGLDWDELVALSQSAERRRPINLKLAGTTELGRYPPTPYLTRYTDSGFMRDPAVMSAHRKAENTLLQEIKQRLAESSKKEIVLYVHGFNETFEEAAFTAAELCHFLGREHLCTFFTWPAGSSGGLLSSYRKDRESGEFSVTHLKRALRSLVGVPGVEKVHLLAHSRGADVLLQAVRELMLEVYVSGDAPRDILKIENLVLMAADVDTHVFLGYLSLYGSDPEMPSHWHSDELPLHLRGRMTIYTSGSDRALLASTVLFRSLRRLGRVGVDDLTDHLTEFLTEAHFVDIIKIPDERIDFLGHGYFTNHPAVSSDLMALIRYGLGPEDAGRSLRQVKPPIIWAIKANQENQH